jgi:hypothetical protein
MAGDSRRKTGKRECGKERTIDTGRDGNRSSECNGHEGEKGNDGELHDY